jgi:pimeloyl-ACP methyl ester carboxylesterase
MADQLYAGLKVRAKACFIAGACDWGVHQSPGALAAMETRLSTDWRGIHLVPGAGHWVQQEQPEAVLGHLHAFLS